MASPNPVTRVKICGITRPQDGCAAAAAGADAIGLVFYPPSPRAVTLAVARAVVAALPPLVGAVALFVDPDRATVEQVLAEVPLDLIQFHGNESPAFCRSFHRPYIKALRVTPEVDVEAALAAYGDARALLLDSYHPELPGGTGRTFDWSLVPAALWPRVMLAGGLDAANVVDAIRRYRPAAVDVSGGVEASKGVKDPIKIAEFMRGVRSA
ncbi:MAG: phosphoribosylanthranilate isomerase [Gammaproteobacteria bacterium]|nr:phosphoribosylanthranilate isomerase [Gammaproteobacteria bacterium]